MYRTTEPRIKQFLIAPCRSNNGVGGGRGYGERRTTKEEEMMVD